jgi:23S rRNA (cytidine1920-2'-O)/16S rRNA (cytidine1409-2'-O)-methyltransferase
MRLDLYLVKHYDIQSRNKASELIASKKVKIDGTIVTKSSFKVEEGTSIEILEDQFFVSRAAYKLKYFLEECPINLQDLDALDIGSSTGGFTQILLQNGVKSVDCVDVGSNQLHEIIKDDARISCFENTDIRDFQSQKVYDIVTCDVSFISIHNILPSIDNLANKKIIILFKPQFEVGKDVKRDRAGVVKDNQAIEREIAKFEAECFKLGWSLVQTKASKLEGKKGNLEQLFYFEK